jgi:hypothetical protein
MEATELEVLAGKLCARLVASEVYLDAPMLTGLGSGVLVFELRHGLCRHGQRWVPPLIAVARLRGLLREELNRNGPPAEELTAAEVTVRVRLSPQKGGRNSKMTWVGAGEDFIACALEIEARLATLGASAGFRQSATLEWPRQCRLWQLPPLDPAGVRRA